MEAIGLAASIITLAGTALQSTRLLNEFISNTVRRPQLLEDVSFATKQLEKALSYIKTVGESSPHQQDALDNTDLALQHDLRTLLAECDRDLKEMRNKLFTFSVSGTNSAGKIKRAFKVLTNDHELQGMWKRTQSYTELFSIYLGHIGIADAKLNSNLTRNIQNELKDFRVLTADQDNTILSELRNLQSIFETSAVRQDLQSDLVLARIDQNTSAIHKFRGQQSFQNNRLLTHIKQVTDQQVKHFDQSHHFHAASHDNLQLHLEEIQGQLIDVKISSAAIEIAIKDLQRAPRCLGQSYSDVNETRAVRSDGLFPTPDRTDFQNIGRFRGAMQRILDFSTNEDIPSHSARLLHLDMTTVLSHLEVTGQFVLPWYCEFRRSDLLDNIGPIRSGLQMSRRLQIEDFETRRLNRRADEELHMGNEFATRSRLPIAHELAGLRKRKRGAAPHRITCRRKLQRPDSFAKDSNHHFEKSGKHVAFSLMVDGARIDILAFETSPVSLRKGHHLADEDRGPGSWSTTVFYTPNIPARFRKQVILKYEHHMDFMNASVGPTILTYRSIREASSKVFGIARNGSMDQLRKLLDSGEASITDCNERGASVYATDNKGVSPSDIACSHGNWQEWADALTECGFDPDEVASYESDIPAWSSGIDYSTQSSRRGVPTLTFAEYLRIRKQRYPEVQRYWEEMKREEEEKEEKRRLREELRRFQEKRRAEKEQLQCSMDTDCALEPALESDIWQEFDNESWATESPKRIEVEEPDDDLRDINPTKLEASGIESVEQNSENAEARQDIRYNLGSTLQSTRSAKQGRFKED
ncbi:MAG: hypothetical protein Q9160_002377 [Pyrenula sp. 1 TL-2023]